jgi:DNA-directed RNA polymerase specialized sigma24 family protein
MPDAAATGNAPKQDCLSSDEISAAFDGLSPDDRLKLRLIENHLLGGTGMSKGDLVHEAVCRSLTGRRNCPRHINFMAFLVETMKSIASHAREKRRRSPPVGELDATSITEASDIALALSPEDQLIEKSRLQEIYGHFEDDGEAGLVLLGLADGLRGKELREFTGLDQPGLDYALKRIRKRMRNLYPNGCLP